MNLDELSEEEVGRKLDQALREALNSKEFNVGKLMKEARDISHFKKKIRSMFM